MIQDPYVFFFLFFFLFFFFRCCFVVVVAFVYLLFFIFSSVFFFFFFFFYMLYSLLEVLLSCVPLVSVARYCNNFSLVLHVRYICCMNLSVL